jgi:hypothetical protein
MKETFNVSEEEVDDFTGNGPWLISGETYTYIEDFLSKGDGECHDVIVQRARMENSSASVGVYLGIRIITTKRDGQKFAPKLSA